MPGIVDDVTATAQSGAAVIDQFNDTDFSEYSGDTASASQNTSIQQEGSGCLEFAAADSFNQRIYSTSGDGLDNYPGIGNEFRCWVRYDDANINEVGVHYGLSDESNWFRATIEPVDQVANIFRTDGTDGNSNVAATTGITFSTNTWYEIVIKWDDGSTFGQSEGWQQMDVLDTNGDSIDANFPISGTDTHHTTNTGVGFQVRNTTDGAGNMFADDYRSP